MKNANSRFVRVLAIVLVVLMVVPAALVGCGSNKANNAAISEALAAAEAARKEAEEAKAAADAAAAEAAAKAAEEAAKLLEEANKKAEEALKAAEEAKKELEEAMKTTAAPVTQAPTTAAPAEDLKVVSDYAFKVLNDHTLDFLKTYYMYAAGATEEDLEDEDYSPVETNPVYSSVDIKAMVKLYEAAKIAILQANTVDYINQIVANFVAAIKAIPTYVERVIDAYEAIDFASKYDVIDVVYANEFVDKALEELSGDAEADFIAALTKYGEDELNVLEAIDTEYYRYTGVTGDYADTSAVEDVLYADMYNDADDIAVAVATLVGAEVGEELDVAALGYAADIDDDVAAVVKMYAAWNNTYFVKSKDAELVNHYEAFRQAFVGEAYVAEYANDYVWDALAAFEARAAELLAAAAEYKEVFKSALTKVAGYTTINYWKQAEQVATVKAALDAWKTKYNFKDDEHGNPDDNVLAIIGRDVVEGETLIELGTYNKYLNNALIIEYFVYLEKTASAVNVDDFVKAYNSDLNEEDLVVTFDFAKYGSAVASAIDWYYGKEKNGTRANGFIHIAPANVKGFEALGAEYAVETLVNADPVNVNIAKIFDNLFDLDIADDDKTVFASMKTAYEELLLKKKAADRLNKAIEEALEKGVDIDVLDDVEGFIGADPEAVLNPEDDDDLYLAVAGSVGTWATDDYIMKGDVNFENMIDWASIEALYANYKASTAEVEKVAIKIALEYIAWKGEYLADDEAIKFAEKIFEDLEPVEINIFSYDMIKEIVDTYEAIQNIDKGDTPVVVPAADDETYNITLETVTDYCYEMLVYFYDIVDSLNKNLYAEIYKGYPLLDKAAYQDVSFPYATRENEWFKLTTQDYIFELIEALHGTLDSTVKAGIKSAFGTSKAYLGYSTLQFSSVMHTFYEEDGVTEKEKVKKVSYQYAIASVDPDKYTTKNSNGAVVSFDGAAYKKAVDESIASTYTSYLTNYAKTASRATALSQIVDIIATQTLNTGLWNFADEISIYGDIYDFSVNVDETGKAWQFVVTDVDGDVVGAAKAGETVTVEVKYDGEDYDITLTPTLVDGKFVVTPALALEEGQEVEFTVYDLLDDIDADDVDALVYDVRDAVDAIVANLDKVTNIPLLGNKKATLDTFTADQINSMFEIEAKNDFWVEFATLKARMYGSATKSAAQFVFGNYISNFVDVLGKADVTAEDANVDLTDEAIAVKAKLQAASVMVYEKVKGMTPETNTIEEVLKIFNTFKNDVKNILAENQYTFVVVDENAAYEQITVTAPTAD